MLVLLPRISKPLVAVAAFVQKYRVVVNASFMRVLLQVRIEDFRAKLALEDAQFMRVHVNPQGVSVHEPSVALLARVVSVVRVHVFMQHFELIETFKTNAALKIRRVEFEGDHLIFDVREDFPVVFPVEMRHQVFEAINAAVANITAQIGDIKFGQEAVFERTIHEFCALDPFMIV